VSPGAKIAMWVGGALGQFLQRLLLAGEAYGSAIESTCLTDLGDRHFRVVLNGSTTHDTLNIFSPGFGRGFSLSQIDICQSGAPTECPNNATEGRSLKRNQCSLWISLPWKSVLYGLVHER